MSDLQKRLRKGQRIDSWGFHTPTRLDKEAADEIERLQASLEIANDGWAVGEAENIKLQARVDELEERIEKLLASKFAASSPKLIAKIITLASEGEK